MQKDLEIVKDVFEVGRKPIPEIGASIELIRTALVRSCSDLREGLRMISFMLLSRLSLLNKQEVLLHRFLYGVAMATQIPLSPPVIFTRWSSRIVQHYTRRFNIVESTSVHFDVRKLSWDTEKNTVAVTEVDIQVTEIEKRVHGFHWEMGK